MKRFTSDSICIALFVAIISVFFYPTLTKGYLPVPSDALVGLYHPWRDTYANEYPRGIPFKNFLITDPIRQQIPWRKIAIDQWKNGRVPVWNPFNFSGTPLVGNIQAAAFYPLNILFFLFEFPIAWTILILLQPLLAGLFLYMYLRHLRVHPFVSLFGAIAWSFSGFSVAWLTWGTMMHVALWLPLILISIDKLIELRKSIALHSTVLWLIVLVMTLSMQFLAGHAQVSLYILILSIAYALWQLRLIKTDRTKTIRWLLFGFFLFVVFTSIQWIPLFRATISSSRLLELASWTNPGWFLPWVHLVQFIAPDFFGNPATLNYWGVWNYGEFIGYIGIIPLFFALNGVLHNERRNQFWIFVALGTLLLMTPNIISQIPYTLKIPLWTSLQPTRLMVLFDFALVMLASLAFDDWFNRKNLSYPLWEGVIMSILYIIIWIFTVVARFVIKSDLKDHLLISQRNFVLPTGIFVFLLLFLYFLTRIRDLKMRNACIVIGFIGVTSFDLLRFGWKFTPFTSIEYFFPPTQITRFLESRTEQSRIVNLDNRIFPPNTQAYYGIESIEGYDPIYNRRYEEFLAALSRGKADIQAPFGFNRILTTRTLDSPLLALLNVGYVLSLEDIERADFIKVFQEGQTRAYQYTHTLPRSYMVENAIVEPNKQKIMSLLYQDNFDSRYTAVVEEPLSLLNTAKKADEWVHIGSYDSSEMILSVQTNGNRLVVMSTVYTPSIKAFIDAEKTQVHRVNFALSGIVVPGGDHVIKIVFQ